MTRTGIDARGFAAVLAALPLVIGCGNGLSQVAGKLTLDGQPVRKTETLVATVVFQPEGGSGAQGVARVDAEGRYAVATGSSRGVQPGPYLVSVNVIERTPSPSGGPPGRKRVSPDRYANPTTSGLRCDVGPGATTFDIELSSKP